MRYFALLAVGAVGLAASPANATLQIAADFGGALFSCVDNDAACDQDNATGTLQLKNQTIGGVQVNGSVQTSVGTLLTAGSPPSLNTSSLSVINTTAAPVAYHVMVGDKDFVGPASSFASAGSGVWQQANGSTITLSWYDDAANVQGAGFAGDTPGVKIDTFSDTANGIADSFAHNGSGPVVDGALFSMTLDAQGTLTGHGQLINRGATLIKQIPEPGTLGLLGAALLGFAYLRRQMRPSA